MKFNPFLVGGFRYDFITVEHGDVDGALKEYGEAGICSRTTLR